MKFFVTVAAVLLGSAPVCAQTMSGGTMSHMAMPKCTATNPVVWVNTSSKVYYLKGAAYYGKTMHGRYMCRSAAVAMGDHQARKTSSTMHHSTMSTQNHGMMMPHPMNSPMDNGSMGSGTAPPMSQPMPMHSTMPMPVSSPPNPAPSPYGSVPPKHR